MYWAGYLLFLNNVWVVIPLLCCWQACAKINQAVAQSTRCARTRCSLVLLLLTPESRCSPSYCTQVKAAMRR